HSGEIFVCTGVRAALYAARAARGSRARKRPLASPETPPTPPFPPAPKGLLSDDRRAEDRLRQYLRPDRGGSAGLSLLPVFGKRVPQGDQGVQEGVRRAA